MTALLLSYIALISHGALFEVNDNPEPKALTSFLQGQGSVLSVYVLYRPDYLALTQLVISLGLPTILHNINTSELERRLEYHTPSSIVLVLDETLTVESILNNTIRNHETIYAVKCTVYEKLQVRFQEFWRFNIIAAYAFVDDGFEVNFYGFEPTPDGILVKKKDKFDEKLQVEFFDLHGMRMNNSVVNIAPGVILNANDDTKPEGVEARILPEVALKFNVKPHFAVPLDGELWGWTDPKPAGVIGEILKGYSDFGFGALVMNELRAKVLDYLIGFTPMECITWAVPKGAGPRTAVWISMLLTEFSIETWAAIAGCTFAVILATLLVDHHPLGPTLLSVFATSIGSAVNLPKKGPARILVLFWVWASLILAVAYTASMGSKLAVPPSNPDIETYIGLLQSGLTLTGVYNTLLVVRAEDPDLKIIVKQSKPTTVTVAEALHRMVEKRDVAYMRQGTLFRYHAIVDPKSTEGIHIMKACAIQYYPAIILAKWSPFYRGAQTVVQRLFEGGIIKMWASRLMPEYTKLPQPPMPLHLEVFFGGFATLSAGLMLALIAFTVEVFLSNASSFKRKLCGEVLIV